MTPRTSSPRQDPAASRAIDAIIEASGDWRSTMLARLRAVILSAGASIVEEVKWKKPSRPMGVPVWSRDGNICIGEALKSAVRLTFPKGALLEDPGHVFNTRLDSATVRAVRDTPGRECGGEAVGVFGRDVWSSAVCQLKNGGEPGVTSASSEVDRRSSGLASSPSKISRAGR